MGRLFLASLIACWLGATAYAQEADYAKGLQYHRGEGVVQNYAKAADFFTQAAMRGHAPSQNYLGRYFFEGLGVAQNVPTAIAYLEQAAQAGDPQHIFDLAKVLEGDENSAARAARLYETAAAGGHPEASVSLGVLYQEGRGVPQDFAKALALYEEPARQGHARALNNLGLLYVRGTGVAQDYERAASYFSAAAEQGLQTAMTNLGVLYENGFGVALNEARAAELYRLGGSGAQASTSVRFVYDARLKPLEVTRDAQAALVKAAGAGDPVARFQLGWALVQGVAVTHAHLAQAAQLFRQAGEAGHGPSMVNLAAMYVRGDGVPQDYVLAKKWALLGAAHGADVMPDSVVGLEQVLTADQINLAQSMAGKGLNLK